MSRSYSQTYLPIEKDLSKNPIDLSNTPLNSQLDLNESSNLSSNFEVENEKIEIFDESKNEVYHNLFQDFWPYLQDQLGIPIWAVVILFTSVVRVAILPMFIYQYEINVNEKFQLFKKRRLNIKLKNEMGLMDSNEFERIKEITEKIKPDYLNKTIFYMIFGPLMTIELYSLKTFSQTFLDQVSFDYFLK